MTTQVPSSLLQEKTTCEALLKELESNQDKYSPNLKADLDFAIEQVKSRLRAIENELKTPHL